jgi:hypothetical protein
MAPWLVNLLQQFGRDIVTATPEVINGVKKEHRAARDPYLDKKMYWFGRGGEAERDAAAHRFYDSMTAEQRERLAALHASGTWPAYENTKEQYRRPWTGAYESVMLSAPGWPRLQPFAHRALDLMSTKGRFREDVEEDSPSHS